MNKKYLPLIILLTIVITAGGVFGGEWLFENSVGHRPLKKMTHYSSSEMSIWYASPEKQKNVDIINRKQQDECAEILAHIRIYEEVELAEIPSYSYREKQLPYICVSVNKNSQLHAERTVVSIYNSEICFINEISYRMKLPEEYYNRYIALSEVLDIAIEGERS